MRYRCLLHLALFVLLASGCASTGSELVPRPGRINLNASQAEREAYFHRAEARVEGQSTWVGEEPYTDMAVREHYLHFNSHNAARYARQAHTQARSATLGIWLPPVIGLGVGAIGGLIWAAVESAVNSVNAYSYYPNSPPETDFVGHVLIGAGAGASFTGLVISLPLGLSKANSARAQRERAADSFNRDLEEALELK